MQSAIKQNTRLANVCRTTLNLTENALITQEHITTITTIFKSYLEEDYSPTEIAKMHNITDTKNFSAFLVYALRLKLKSVKEANLAYCRRRCDGRTDEKQKYWIECKFRFGIYDYPKILGYDLLKEFGIYNPNENIGGASRDHMLSIYEGHKNNISSDIISHPANCRILLQSDNSSKGNASCIDLSTLLKRIHEWDSDVSRDLHLVYRTASRSEEHKKKISETLSNKIAITDGKVTLKIKKTDTMPDGFRRGMAPRKAKL